MAVTQAFNLANLALSAGGGSNVNVAVWNGNVTTVNWMNAGNISAAFVNGGNVNVSGAINFSDGSSIISNAAALVLFDYTGDGTTTTFSTGNYYATTVGATNVYMGGLYQRKNQYNWVGTNIIFNNPPPNGVNVEVQINTLSYAIAVPSAGSVQPTTLSPGGPSWDTGGNVSITANLTVGGAAAFVGNIVSGGNVVATTLQATGNVLLFNGSDPANSSRMTVAMLSSESTIRSGASGSGTQLPMTFHANGSERMRINTTGNVGIGTTLTPLTLTVTGDIAATRNIYSNYSDMRLKVRGADIADAVSKVMSIDTFYYEPNDLALQLGSSTGRHVGVSAQSVQAVMPETIGPSPLDTQYMTVQYERLVPLLIAAIKEQQQEIQRLRADISDLMSGAD